MEQALVIIEDDTSYLADSRQIAKQLGIAHRSFFRMIKEYQQEIEEDFGTVRFEITPKMGSKAKAGGDQPKYAFLTEDQAYAYLAYSQNTEQARRCKRNLVKAFSLAREIILALVHAPEAELDGLSSRQVRMIGLAGKLGDYYEAGLPWRPILIQLSNEATAMTPEERTWKPFPQPVKLLR